MTVTKSLHAQHCLITRDIRIIENTAPIRPLRIFNTERDIARLNRIHAPRIRGARSKLWQGVKTIHKPPAAAIEEIGLNRSGQAALGFSADNVHMVLGAIVVAVAFRHRSVDFGQATLPLNQGGMEAS